MPSPSARSRCAEAGDRTRYGESMAADPEFKQKVEELLQENEVLLFMKGTPEMPRCGFSMRVVGVLEQLGVEYGAVDVLPVLDPLREVTGEISDWRTFPQLYVNGDLVGGCDIVEEMLETGELSQLLGVEQPESLQAPTQPQPADPQQSPPLKLG
jgi:monothiol glutaredoxin